MDEPNLVGVYNRKGGKGNGHGGGGASSEELAELRAELTRTQMMLRTLARATGNAGEVEIASDLDGDTPVNPKAFGNTEGLKHGLT